MTNNSERGAALILALMLLSFLAVLGGALLTSTAIDVWIGDNYKTHTQVRYLAETGIELARQKMLVSGVPLGSLLVAAAGADGVLSASRDLQQLQSEDDVPLVAIADSSGRYTVWLRNDIAEGVTTTAESNGVVTLLSIAEVGKSRTTVEVDVRKGAFPDLFAGLTVDATGLDPRLRNVRGLNRLMASITRDADNVYDSVTIGNYGSASVYPVAVVDGDCTLGPGTGFGLLLVRGSLTMAGAFAWDGLILVIGKGEIHWPGDAFGRINGGVFVARTIDGTAPTIDVLVAGGAGIQYDAGAIARANAGFPYTPIAFREY